MPLNLWCRVGFGHVGNMDQAAFLIELADDLRELLSRSAGQNDCRTLGAHAVLYHRKSHEDAMRSWAKKHRLRDHARRDNL
jgi:hypothetical protein